MVNVGSTPTCRAIGPFWPDFWHDKGKVITGSLYKRHGRSLFSDVVDESALQYCQEMVDKYQLADAFVMDIALTEYGYKIIECGCINCAGFYEANMQKLIMALEDAFRGNNGQ